MIELVLCLSCTYHLKDMYLQDKNRWHEAKKDDTLASGKRARTFGSERVWKEEATTIQATFPRLSSHAPKPTWPAGLHWSKSTFDQGWTCETHLISDSNWSKEHYISIVQLDHHGVELHGRDDGKALLHRPLLLVEQVCDGLQVCFHSRKGFWAITSCSCPNFLSHLWMFQGQGPLALPHLLVVPVHPKTFGCFFVLGTGELPILILLWRRLGWSTIYFRGGFLSLTLHFFSLSPFHPKLLGSLQQVVLPWNPL